MLAKGCQVLGPPGQNLQVRIDRFDEMVNARVNLEFASARAVVAMFSMAEPFIPPEGTAPEREGTWVVEEQERRMTAFRQAAVELKHVLDFSLGHLAAHNPRLPIPPPS